MKHFTDYLLIKEIQQSQRPETGFKTRISKDFKLTEWQYGLRLTYELYIPDHKTQKISEKNSTELVIHFKDDLKIQAGKRWSQCMYFYYLLKYRWENEMDPKLTNLSPVGANGKPFPFILALDGDIDFKPEAFHSVLTLCAP